MTDYRIHATTLDGTALPGCSGYASEVARSSFVGATAGAVHPRMVAAQRYAKALSLQTAGLKTLLSKMLPTGSAHIPCASLGAGAGMVMACTAVDDVLPAETAGAAELMTIARGLIGLRSIACNNVGDAITCDVGVWPISADGAADVWSIAAGAIPSLPSTEEDYALHSITWKGTALTGAEGINLRVGISPEFRFNPGAIYPTQVRTIAGGPILNECSFTLPDRSALRAWGQHYHGAAVGDLALVFRPFAIAAARDASAGQTITVTLTGVGEITGADDGNPSNVQALIRGVVAAGTKSLAWAAS